jgi:hypothetical protein
MKIDYIEEVNDFGDSIVRLYNGSKTQSAKLKVAIEKIILKNRQSLLLNSLDFIEESDISLTFHIAMYDEGITSEDDENFNCHLTLTAYRKMIAFIIPFTKKDTKAFQRLYDADNNIDLMFVPSGT